MDGLYRCEDHSQKRLCYLRSNRLTRPILAIALALTSLYLDADDWPEWRGKSRLGVWNESGILDEFPKDGLAIQWRTPIKGGYSGPSVADGRVFVTDFTRALNTKGSERILCLD